MTGSEAPRPTGHQHPRPAVAASRPPRLVAFDLDGTLIRGETCAEALARRLGHLDRMRAFERLTDIEGIARARAEMAEWYRGVPMGDLQAALSTPRLAPGAREGLDLLRRHGIVVVVISITWEFAVAHLARDLGAEAWVGTGLEADGSIRHMWPEDKRHWLIDRMRERGLVREEVAAVGDSWGDVPMLGAVGQAVFVGPRVPAGLEHATHLPDGDILTIARHLIGG
jgi:HAD superfamily phosphoserine phosphatase-like hydrolase